VTPVLLSDDEVAELSERRGRPLRNLTRQQWSELAAKLPRGSNPTREMFRSFLFAANRYWDDAARPSPKKRARLVRQAEAHVLAAIEKIDVADTELVDDMKQLAAVHGRLQWQADNWDDAVARAAGRSDFGAHEHRHEYLGAALDLWVACGGEPKFSRNASGPLIRSLTFACGLVGLKYSRRALAEFVIRYRE
jgi:hypothetical protein